MELKSTGRFTSSLRKLMHYRHDQCSVCGTRFQHGVAAFAGYGADGRDLHVGTCCSGLLKELATHSYWWWSNYKRPQPTTVIWRYMDFAKLMAVVNSQSLYFARADKLGDPFEGARGIAARAKEWRDYAVNYFKDAIRTAPNPNGMPPMPPDALNAQAERLFEEFTRNGEAERLETYASCWHANQVESEAQWRIYAPPGTPGVAIRTTFGQLDSALDQSFEVYAGYVQYVDYRTAFAGTYDRIFWKRLSLAHENEVRLVLKHKHFAVQDLFAPTQAVGVNVAINLATAIDAIVVSPYAPPWVLDTVRNTLARYGLSVRVEESTLLAAPFF